MKEVYAFIDKASKKGRLNTEYMYVPKLSKFYTYMKRSQNIAKSKNVDLMFLADIIDFLMKNKIYNVNIHINMDANNLLNFEKINQKIKDLETSTTKRGVNKNKASYSESRRLLKKLNFLRKNQKNIKKFVFLYEDTSFLKSNINLNVLKETEIQGLTFKRVDNVSKSIDKNTVKIHVDASTKNNEYSSIAVKVVEGFKDIEIVKTIENFKFTTQAEYMAMEEGLKLAEKIRKKNPEKKIFLYGDSLNVVDSMNSRDEFDKFIRKEERRAANDERHIEAVKSMKNSYKIIENSWNDDEPNIVVLKIDRALNAADKVLRKKK